MKHSVSYTQLALLQLARRVDSLTGGIGLLLPCGVKAGPYGACARLRGHSVPRVDVQRLQDNVERQEPVIKRRLPVASDGR